MKTPEEMREYKRLWARANKEKLAEAAKLRYYANPEKQVERRKRYRAENKEKVLAGQKRYRDENKETVLAGNRAYVEANKEKVLEGQRRYRSENSDKVKLSARKFYVANREKVRAKRSCRRAAELARTCNWEKELTELVELESAALAIARKNITGFTWNVDHIIPLKGKTVSGLHVWNNLAVIPERINKQKGNKFPYGVSFYGN